MKNKEDIYKILSIVLILDQGIKLIVQQKMILNQVITIIPKFFSLCYVQNTGAAFSILKDSTVLLTILSAVILAILSEYIKKEKHFSKLAIISYGLVTGGIVGNMIDRILHHAVIDYLSFEFFSYSFPIFNIADVAITVGVCLLMIDMFKEKGKSENEESTPRIVLRSTKRKSSNR